MWAKERRWQRYWNSRRHPHTYCTDMCFVLQTWWWWFINWLIGSFIHGYHHWHTYRHNLAGHAYHSRIHRKMNSKFAWCLCRRPDDMNVCWERGAKWWVWQSIRMPSWWLVSLSYPLLSCRRIERRRSDRVPWLPLSADWTMIRMTMEKRLNHDVDNGAWERWLLSGGFRCVDELASLFLWHDMDDPTCTHTHGHIISFLAKTYANLSSNRVYDCFLNCSDDGGTFSQR